MLSTQPFMRDDTFLGVCQALGDDLGFNPNFLRVALAPLVIWNPVLVAMAYVAVAVLIAILHFIVPSPRGVFSTRENDQPKQVAPKADNEPLAEDLAAAA